MECIIRNKTKHHEYDAYFPELEKVMRKTLKHLKLTDDYVISCTLVGPISIRRINRDFRNIDRVTDVISFAVDDGGEFVPEGEEHDLGDIFINVNRVKTQAEEYGHSEKREFLFLFTHGLLHCLGYDHMTEEDEEVMFSLQREILGERK